jgi:hypothetical protein
MNAQESSSCSSVSLTSPQIKETAKKTLENLLPDKSKSQYEKEFQKFEEWRRQNNIEVYNGFWYIGSLLLKVKILGYWLP